MTKREALTQCLKVWQYLADNPHLGPENKIGVVQQLLGYRPHNSCPACEYADHDPDEPNEPDCDTCPIEGWSSEKTCFDTVSGEYFLWRAEPNRQPFAQAIADRAQRSLDLLEKNYVKD
jgi:hypothetical protein